MGFQGERVFGFAVRFLGCEGGEDEGSGAESAPCLVGVIGQTVEPRRAVAVGGGVVDVSGGEGYGICWVAA